MALDKLPDPLPLRHSKQWGGRAMCRQWDMNIRLHLFLLDQVMTELIWTALSERLPACKVLCPELTTAWAQHSSLTLKSQGWENNKAKVLSAVWHKQPSPPSAESYRFAAPVWGPACNLFRLPKPGDYSNSLKQVSLASMILFCFVLFNCLGLGLFFGGVFLFVHLFLVFMLQDLDPRQDYKGKLLVLHLL